MVINIDSLSCDMDKKNHNIAQPYARQNAYFVVSILVVYSKPKYNQWTYIYMTIYMCYIQTYNIYD